MSKIYVIPALMLPQDVGYLEVVGMNEPEVKKLPGVLDYSPTEFENEFNADCSAYYTSGDQYIRIF